MANYTFNGGLSNNINCKVPGGIKCAYLISASDAFYTPISANGELTGIASGGAVRLNKLEIPLGLGSADESLSTDPIKGTFVITQSITIGAVTISASRLRNLQSFIGAMAVLVHYNSGATRLFGMKYFLEPDGLDISSGAGQSDTISISFSLNGEEVTFAPILQNSSLDAPLGGLVLGVDYTLITE